MGTETELRHGYPCLRVRTQVKLNNPLMGTETRYEEAL